MSERFIFMPVNLGTRLKIFGTDRDLGMVCPDFWNETRIIKLLASRSSRRQRGFDGLATILLIIRGDGR